MSKVLLRALSYSLVAHVVIIGLVFGTNGSDVDRKVAFMQRQYTVVLGKGDKLTPEPSRRQSVMPGRKEYDI